MSRNAKPRRFRDTVWYLPYKRWWVKGQSWQSFLTGSVVCTVAWILLAVAIPNATHAPPSWDRLVAIEGIVADAHLEGWGHLFFHLDGNPAQFYYPPIAGDVDNVAAALRPGTKVELRVDGKDIEIAKHNPKHYVTVIAVSLNHAPIRTYEDAVTAWNDDGWTTRWGLSPIVDIIVGLLVVALWATTWIEWREKNGK